MTTLISSKHLYTCSHTLHKVAKGKVCLAQGHFDPNTSNLPIRGFRKGSPLSHSYPGCSLHLKLVLLSFLFQVHIVVKLDEDFFLLHGRRETFGNISILTQIHHRFDCILSCRDLIICQKDLAQPHIEVFQIIGSQVISSKCFINL